MFIKYYSEASDQKKKSVLERCDVGVRTRGEDEGKPYQREQNKRHEPPGSNAPSRHYFDANSTPIRRQFDANSTPIRH